MAWTRRVLRCALLRTSPGDDVLADDAHCRCRFGIWFRQNRKCFDAVDADAALDLDSQEQRMHDAVRMMCNGVLAGAAGLALLQVADNDPAEHTAPRLLQSLRDAALVLSDGGTLNLTMSAGLAESVGDEAMAKVVGRADKALYEAKAAGRDCWRRAPSMG